MESQADWMAIPRQPLQTVSISSASEPAVQYKFGALVGAAGVLFTIAGQNDIAAIYPNISLYYYWDKDGKGVMR
jgi:hypothetical protein